MIEPIKLPPLPDLNSFEYHDGLYDQKFFFLTPEKAQSYARAAIEADRQTRGEPELVGWAVGTKGGGFVHARTHTEAQATRSGYSLPLYRLCAPKTQRQDSEPVKPHTKFDDPRAQKVYEIICGDNHPPEGEHWDGYVSRLIVDALFPDEPVSALTKAAGAMPSGMNYTVEPHGNGYAIYQGRDNMHHGFNLAHLTECTKEFASKIETALNVANEPVKVPSDDEIISIMSDFAMAHETDKGIVRYTKFDIVDGVRALLASYGQPAQPNVPEPLKYGENWKDHYVTGWNNCRAAMLKTAPESKGER